MRFARYQAADGLVCQGIVENDSIVQIEGNPFAGYNRTGTRARLASVKLLPPLIPGTLFAVGLNYRTHFHKHHKSSDGEVPPFPTESHVGYRTHNALIAHGDCIVIPRGSSGAVQFEGELVAVIGRRTRNVDAAQAMASVFGYTIGNDVSERVWQKNDRTTWRSKNSDTFNPMGPWIETDFDLDRASTIVRLNGEEVSRFATADMIFGVGDMISRISRHNTLHPGDVVWMGTDEPTLDMVPGDYVEVEISGIGSLGNHVAGEW